MRTRLYIVGLRHYSWQSRIAEIFAPGAGEDATCMGQKLYLRRDLHCEGDAHAVMAWSNTEPVGHVSRVNLPLIVGVLEQGKRDVVVTRIVGLYPERRALEVESVEDLPEIPYQDPQLPPWTWDGPVLPLPMLWAQADHLAGMMDMMAEGELEWDEEVLNRYLQLTVTDLSDGAYKGRIRLVEKLRLSADPRLNKFRHLLLSVMDHMGSSERQLEWCNLMTTQLLNSPEARSLASRYAEVDVQQVLSAIRSFPLDIGREWLAGNAEPFANRLYYGGIPRTDILKLFSVMILYNSACRKLSPVSAQPAIGVSLNGDCRMSVEQFTNSGLFMNIDHDGSTTQP